MKTLTSITIALIIAQSNLFAQVNSPELGMNDFLRKMNITFRQDPRTLRPRVNKKDSQLDKKQKAEGKYFVAVN